MKFKTRKWIKPGDLNPNGTLFGGRLLEWIDEEAALFAIIQFDNKKVVTKSMGAIEFLAFAKQGDIVEIGLKITKVGNAYIALCCEVRNIMTQVTIISISNIVMVNLGEDGKPKPHNRNILKA